MWIHLTTHNRTANSYNDRQMELLQAPPHTFKADIEGVFPEYSYPTDVSLTLKTGAQVMFVKNDSSPEKRYYNGKIGVVDDIVPEGIVVRTQNEQTSAAEYIIVSTETWEKRRLRRKWKALSASILFVWHGQ